MVQRALTGFAIASSLNSVALIAANSYVMQDRYTLLVCTGQVMHQGKSFPYWACGLMRNDCHIWSYGNFLSKASNKLTFKRNARLSWNCTQQYTENPVGITHVFKQERNFASAKFLLVCCTALAAGVTYK